MVRVMLIDDEESALDILEILLCKIGNITVAGRFLNPLQALRALETMKPDVVFMDIQMPGMLGMEAAKQVRAKLPYTQIVFTTAFSEYALQAFDVGSIDYLLKPFTMDRLRETVSRFVKAPAGHNLSVAVTDKERNDIQWFGDFRFYAGNGLLSWKTSKEKELCAFLIHHSGHSVDASTIIEALWPESELDKAKSYLYTCMSFLRKSFQANGVRSRVEKVGGGYFINAQEMRSDVAEFTTILETAASEEGLNEKQYDRLNALHKGEYLEHCDYHWAVWKREELRSKYIQVLRILHKRFLKDENLSLAIDSLTRLLTLAPDSEKDGRELIKLHLNTDNRNEALKIFRQLEQVVQVNLDVELEEATILLYKNIVRNS